MALPSPDLSYVAERVLRTAFPKVTVTRAGQLAHPEWDDLWAARTPALERIDVPMLVCASFSDQGLHSRGSFEAFRVTKTNGRSYIDDSHATASLAICIP